MILRHIAAFKAWHRRPVTEDDFQEAWAMACMAGAAILVLLCLFAGLVMADWIANGMGG